MESKGKKNKQLRELREPGRPWGPQPVTGTAAIPLLLCQGLSQLPTPGLWVHQLNFPGERIRLAPVWAECLCLTHHQWPGEVSRGRNRAVALQRECFSVIKGWQVVSSMLVAGGILSDLRQKHLPRRSVDALSA